MRCVSFLTDYGLADGFVAACHGMLYRGAPDVTIIDVTHLVPRGDVRHGATVLAQTVNYLPVGVHLAVVDPGVGTERRAVALAAPGGFFVGPDNGLLMPAAAVLGGVHTAVELPVSDAEPATFHGRDVFAPAAAALVVGQPLTRLGNRIDPATLVQPRKAVARVLRATAAARGNGAGPGPGSRPGPGPGPEATVETEVVLVDRFGNTQLGASGTLLTSAGFVPDRVIKIDVHGATRTVRFGRTFGSVPLGEPVVYVDAAGMGAIAVNCGDAAAALGLRPGDLVRLTAS